MNPQTIGKHHNPGKVAHIQCIRGDALTELDIRDKCFLLLIITEGEARLALGERCLTAQAPCLVCFGERESPRLLGADGLACRSVYFHPDFFNINLTFERVRSEDFREAALAHDLYLMLPFTDERHIVLPLPEEAAGHAVRLFEGLAEELECQRDHYWSCRSRTYFIRLILLLERLYGLVGEEAGERTAPALRDPFLRAAVLFVEGHYAEPITRAEIAGAASINHASLDRLFKAELGMTATEYLWHHRLTLAKQQLRFTNLPITEIAAQCGFKTLPHFTRKFEAATGKTPTAFREQALARRLEAFGDL